MSQPSGRGVWFLGLICTFAAVSASDAYCQDAETKPTVAVMVGDVPIYVSEVQRTLQAALQGKPVTKQQLALLQVQTLNQIIQQRLVTLRLEELGRGATEAEIDTAVSQLEEQLASRSQTIEDFLKERQLTIEAVRADIAFKIGSSKYLNEELTDEALQAYFEENRPRFDGSLLNVSHIILQADGPDKATAIKSALREAATIRQRIDSGDLTFEEAAREYSAGPSRQQNGQLGFIPRTGVMDEQFSEAAFNLKQGEISQPVLTKFGVHLIRWTNVQSGDKPWTDVKESLQKALGNKLLNDLATTQRETTQVVAPTPG